MTRLPSNWMPEYVDVDIAHMLPSTSLRISSCKILAPGSFTLITFADSNWAIDSDYLIVCDAANNLVAVPAKLIGKMTVRACERSCPKRRRYWFDVQFWIHRVDESEWTWFSDDSPEALSYLPWKATESEIVLANVMES